MNRLTSAIALALLCCNAQANWERIAEDSAGDIYVDATTIRRTGALTTMLSLTNLKPPKGSSDAMWFKSIAQLDDYDCAGRRVRLKRFSMYSEAMGAGKLVSTSEQDKPWVAVDAGSWNERKLLIACTNR